MTAISSLGFDPKLRPAKTKNCQACGLYRNQYPIFDQADTPQVFWVGLSAVQFSDGEIKQPLSPNTKSGALIEEIERPLKRKYSFYKTNLVKCLPLKAGKIRYPLISEMEKCCPNFEQELNILKPSIVFLLGKQVASFVLKRFSDKEAILCKNFNYEPIVIDNTIFIPVHHPSYILVYDRKNLDKYIKSLRKLCRKLLS